MTTSDDDQKTVPPYEGRRESADVDSDSSRVDRDGAKVGGATGPVESGQDEPQAEPPGSEAGVSAADEQPADETPETDPSDPGVGPAHTPGVTQGEDHATGG
jgi:hypothetical protein